MGIHRNSKTMKLMEPLTPEQEDNILAEVGYSRKQLEADVVQLREWLAEQHHLPPSRLKEKDCFLKTYLTGCKGSIESAKRKLDAYYTYRNCSEIFDNRDPLHAGYQRVNELMNVCLLPKLSKSKDLVMVNMALDEDPKKYQYLYNMRRIIQIIEMQMRMPDVMANGICYIIDMKHFTPGHIVLFTPTIVRDMLHLVQKILPYRMKGLIFVNAPSYMEIALNNLIKPFMTSKMKDRFHVFSGGHEEFYKFVDRSVLPKEFGGDEPATLRELTKAWAEKEVSERDWFLGDLSERTDESKRVNLEYSMSSDPIFGVHGTLKKLVID
uniref:CRAL/TRIO domain containing protein n=1 Tax=Triatoma matogrossensis TaxID=162370 RepID=E2J7G0_9HEMI